jgi:Tol biopolymer transport system component
MYQSKEGFSQEHEIVWLGSDGKRGKSLLNQKGILSFEFSEKKNLLMYSLSSQRAIGDLWLRDIARGASQRFTFGPSSAFAPVWSPDGNKVAFTVYPEDQLVTKATQTSAKEEPLHVTGTNTFASSWSADSKFLVFSQTGETTRNDIWILPLEGDRKPQVYRQTPYSEEDGQISPNGGLMAYTSDASGEREVYVDTMASDGLARQVSVAGGSNPRWRADGMELFFITDRKMMAVAVESSQTAISELSFGMPRKLFGELELIESDSRSSYQPSSDGSEFLVLIPSNPAPAIPPLTVVTNWQTALGR